MKGGYRPSMCSGVSSERRTLLFPPRSKPGHAPSATWRHSDEVPLQAAN